MITRRWFESCTSNVSAIVHSVVGPDAAIPPQFADKVAQAMAEVLCGVAASIAENILRDVHSVRQASVAEDQVCAKIYCPATRQVYAVCAKPDKKLICPGCNRRIAVKYKVVAWVEEE